MWDWQRWCRRALLAAGVVMLWGAGVSIFGQPDREVLYHADPPLTVCHAAGCTILYRLEVGNSGDQAQDEVVVRLRRAVVERPLLPVKVRDFGKIDRPVQIREDGEARAYALGRLEPRVRVEVAFALAGPGPHAAVRWEDILLGVEAPGARVATGHAAWVMVLRGWYAFLALF